MIADNYSLTDGKSLSRGEVPSNHIHAVDAYVNNIFIEFSLDELSKSSG